MVSHIENFPTMIFPGATEDPEVEVIRDEKSLLGCAQNDLLPRGEKYFFDFAKKEMSSISAATFGGIRRQVLEFLDEDLDSPNSAPVAVRSLFGKWLFSKITMFYRFRGEDLERVAERVGLAVRADRNLVTKAEYLQYKDLDAANVLALDFYLSPLGEGGTDDPFFVLQLLNDAHLLRNYSGIAVSDDQIKKRLIRLYRRSESYDQRSNILDVLLKHFPKSPTVLKIKDELSFGAATPGQKNTSVFGNAQNVHDSEIETEAIRVASELLRYVAPIREELEYQISARREEFPPFIYELLRGYLGMEEATDPKVETIFEAFATRVKIDNTPYEKIVAEGSENSSPVGTSSPTFTIFDLLAAIMILVSDLSHVCVGFPPPTVKKEDYAPVLLAEMEESMRLCTTGFVARMMTSLQGQNLPKGEDGTSLFQMRMSESKRLVGILSHRVCQKIKDAPENVVLGSYDPEFRGEYLDFVSKIATEIFSSEDTPAVRDFILALEKFSGIVGVWSIRDGKVSINQVETAESQK